MKITKEVKKLVSEIESKKIIKYIRKIPKIFYDEPSCYFFISELNHKTSYYLEKNYILSKNLKEEVGAGISFQSEYLAFLKSLSEAVERFSLLTYHKSALYKLNYYDLKSKTIDISSYIFNKIDVKNLYFIRGINLTDSDLCYIPAQLVYLGKIDPKVINTGIITSTGAAAGFDKKVTLLKGIYEIIERDCFMSIFYNKISAPRILFNSLKNKKIQNLKNLCDRYKIEVATFDITNDLGIPSFLTLLIDITGIGPALSAGIKSGLNIFDAIYGSIEEAFISRIKMRFYVYKNKITKINLSIKDIKNHIDRGLYYYKKEKIKKIEWLLNNKNFVPIKKEYLENINLSPNKQLKYLINKLKDKGLKIYYCDITLPNFKKINFHVLKVIIPNLQLMHINENYKFINKKRMLKVLKYFGLNKKKFFNKLPHFF